MVVEATYGWYWAVDLLAAAGAEARLAHPPGVNTERLQTRPKRARKVHSAIKDPIGICIHVVRADRPSGTSCLLIPEPGVGERPGPDRCWRRRGQRHRLTPLLVSLRYRQRRYPI